MMAMRALLIICSVARAASSGFLHARPHTEKSVSLSAVQDILSAALSMEPSRLRQLEDELRPMYAALPKDSNGTLEPAVVRYALHRHFVQKHGWHIKGLELVGHASNVSSPAGILKDHVPEYVQGLLEQHMSGRGWHLNDLAIWSAVQEELIQREFRQDLEFVYEMHDFPISNILDQSELDQVIETYLAQYLVDESFTNMRPAALIKEVQDTYDPWDDLVMWAKDLRQSFDFMEASHGNPFNGKGGYSFQRVTAMIQEIMGRYTSFQNLECSTMTDVILGLEHANTGRVPLAKFYEAALQDKWKFWEPKEYLQHAGALDDSDSKRLSVIIPNYVYGMTNCLASSSFFSVCCTNKCDSLVGHLERVLEAPSAAPERIAALVAELPSDTVDAPRELSTALRTRLQEIAAHHDGSVPLHGRLFSQWMHHAYPRECPFPHVDGEQNPLTQEAWAEASGMHYTTSDQDMWRYIRQYKAEHHSEELPWSAAERLVATHRHGQRPRPLWQKGFALVAVVAVAVPLLRTWESVLGMRGTGEAKQCKHLV